MSSVINIATAAALVPFSYGTTATLPPEATTTTTAQSTLTSIPSIISPKRLKIPTKIKIYEHREKEGQKHCSKSVFEALNNYHSYKPFFDAESPTLLISQQGVDDENCSERSSSVSTAEDSIIGINNGEIDSIPTSNEEKLTKLKFYKALYSSYFTKSSPIPKQSPPVLPTLTPTYSLLSLTALDQLTFTPDFYQLSAKTSTGSPIQFSELRGKLILIINIATQCLAAYQLGIFEDLYQRYKDQGLVILAFPSNQFYQERKKSSEEVAQFCEKRFNVSFPIMAKVDLNGETQSEAFRFLKSQKTGFLGSRRVKWNYEKFLIGRDGVVLKRYSTLQKYVEKDLKELFQLEELERKKRERIRHVCLDGSSGNQL